jgi:class 3 adenylate cyclase/tetratricopeptide (TPR) repeat protein
MSITCPNCNAEIASGKRFCGDCGAALLQRCQACGNENPATKNFCETCGTRLEATLPAPRTVRRAGRNAPVQGERRHLTVLFSDLVNSTQISRGMDPEEWRELVADYQTTVGFEVVRFGGYVAQFFGDGIMAYFGWPEAHDNDAERATRASLAILNAIEQRNVAVSSRLQKFAVRLGVHSGQVVIIERDGNNAEVFGDVPNIASRVQSAAEPDTVFITADTHRLVSGMFVVEEGAPQLLKGIDQPQQLYRVVQPSAARGRLRAAAAIHGLTSFVGREDELQALASRWDSACGGDGQMVLISGEAGIGKSRLLEELRGHVAETPHTWIECACVPYYQNTPFYPLAEMLAQAFNWQPGQPEAYKVAQLENSVEAFGLRATHAVPLLASLLNLPLPAKYQPVPNPPDEQRRRLMTILVDWLIAGSRSQPLVFAVEDLHWADPSTLDLIQLAAERCTATRCFIVCTARPEFRLTWPMQGHHTQLTLNRLSARNVRHMLAEITGHFVLPDETVTAMVERTGGVPLFVEELTRAVLENSPKPDAREIPGTLADSLMARLDRLGTAREFAQIAAVIGREFSYELLRALTPVPESELRLALTKLTEVELIFADGTPPEANYTFKHALIQEAAYEALLKSRRRELHRRVAQILIEQFPAVAESRPEVLARHWSDAGEAVPAIDAWRKAGNAARARSAFKEAERSFRNALTLIRALPESAERDDLELKLASAFAGALQVTMGHSARATVEASARIRALAEKRGNLDELVPQLNGAFAAALVSGDLHTASDLANQILDLARRNESPVSLGYAHMDQVLVRYYLGDLAGAEQHFLDGVPFFDAPSFRRFPAGVVSAYNHAALNAWTMGRADLALPRIEAALATARSNVSPYDLAYANFVAGWLYCCMLGQPATGVQLAAQAVALCDDNGFPHFGGLARVALGYATARHNNPEEGVTIIQTGLRRLAEIDSHLGTTHYLTLLADAQILAASFAEALDTIEECLQTNPAELTYRPETLRLRGELRVREGRCAMAEEDLVEAIKQAGEIGAKAWQLRAATSLAQLLAASGEQAAARARLEPVCASFNSGYVTRDLDEARTLLASLSSSTTLQSSKKRG